MDPVSATPVAPRRRSAIAILLLLAATSALACGAPAAEQTATTYLAERAPFAVSGVDTRTIFPRAAGASRFLIRNWPPMRTLEGDTMWIFGKWAQVGFFSIADAPPTFIFEASPFAHADAPTQVVTLFLNDVELEARRMIPGWVTYEFELPAALLTTGWNVLELRFSQTLRPADFDPESADRRTLAAEFRRLEIRSAEMPLRAGERVEEVLVDSAADAGAAAIIMPADSFFEVSLTPAPGMLLVGRLAATIDDAPSALLEAVIEIVENGVTTRIWAARLDPGAAPVNMRADLSAWSGLEITLRVRVFANTRATATWTGTGLTIRPQI